MNSNSYIHLSHAELNVIIGLLPHERIHKQKIGIDLTLALAPQDLWLCARDLCDVQVHIILQREEKIAVIDSCLYYEYKSYE